MEGEKRKATAKSIEMAEKEREKQEAAASKAAVFRRFRPRDADDEDDAAAAIEAEIAAKKAYLKRLRLEGEAAKEEVFFCLLTSFLYSFLSLLFFVIQKHVDFFNCFETIRLSTKNVSGSSAISKSLIRRRRPTRSSTHGSRIFSRNSGKKCLVERTKEMTYTYISFIYYSFLILASFRFVSFRFHDLTFSLISKGYRSEVDEQPQRCHQEQLDGILLLPFVFALSDFPKTST